MDMKKLVFGDMDLPEGAMEQLGLGIPGVDEQSASDDNGSSEENKEEEDDKDVELSGDDESAEDELLVEADDTRKPDRSVASVKEETDSRSAFIGPVASEDVNMVQEGIADLRRGIVSAL